MIVTNHITSVREFSLYLQSTPATAFTGISKFNQQLIAVFLYRFYNNQKFKQLSDQTTTLLIEYFSQNSKLPEIFALCIKYTQQPSSNKSGGPDDDDPNDHEKEGNTEGFMKSKNASKDAQTTLAKSTNEWHTNDMSFFLTSILLLYFDDELLPKPPLTISLLNQYRSTFLHTTLTSYFTPITDLLSFATHLQTQYDHERYKDAHFTAPITPFIHAMSGFSFLLMVAKSNVDNCEDIIKRIEFSRRTVLFWVTRVYETKQSKKSAHDDVDDATLVREEMEEDDAENTSSPNTNGRKKGHSQEKEDDTSLSEQSIQLYGLQTRVLLISFLITVISYHSSNLNANFFVLTNSRFVDQIFHYIHLDPLNISTHLLSSLKEHIFAQLATGNFRLATLLSILPGPTLRPVPSTISLSSHIDSILKIAEGMEEDSSETKLVNDFLFNFVHALLPTIDTIMVKPVVTFTPTDYNNYKHCARLSENNHKDTLTSFGIHKDQLIKTLTRFVHKNQSTFSSPASHSQQPIPLDIILRSKWDKIVAHHVNQLHPTEMLHHDENPANDLTHGDFDEEGEEDGSIDDDDDGVTVNDSDLSTDTMNTITLESINDDDAIKHSISSTIKQKIHIRVLRAILFILRKLHITTSRTHLDFVLTIIRKCPMLYIPYLQSLSFAIKFHSPGKWMHSMAMLHQLLDLTSPNHLPLELPSSLSSTNHLPTSPQYYIATITTLTDLTLLQQVYKGIASPPPNHYALRFTGLSGQLTTSNVFAAALGQDSYSSASGSISSTTIQPCSIHQQQIIASLLVPVQITKSVLSQWILESNVDDKLVVGIDPVNKIILANSQLEVKNVALSLTIRFIQRYAQLAQVQFDISRGPIDGELSKNHNNDNTAHQFYTANITTSHQATLLPLIPIPNTPTSSTTPQLSQTLHGYRHYCPTTHLLLKQILPELSHLMELFTALLPFATGGHFSALPPIFAKSNKTAFAAACRTQKNTSSPPPQLVAFNYLYTIATQPLPDHKVQTLPSSDDDYDENGLMTSLINTNFPSTTSRSPPPPTQPHRPNLVHDILTQIATLFRLIHDIFPDFLNEYKLDLVRFFVKPSLLYLSPKVQLATLPLIQHSIDTNISLGNTVLLFKLPAAFGANGHYELLMSQSMLTPTHKLPAVNAISSLGPLTLFGSLLHLSFIASPHSTETIPLGGSTANNSNLYYGLTRTIPEKLFGNIEDSVFCHLLQNLFQITASPDQLSSIASNCLISVVLGDKLTLFDDSAPYQSLRVRIVNESREENGQWKTNTTNTSTQSPEVTKALAKLIPNPTDSRGGYTTTIWDPATMIDPQASPEERVKVLKQVIMRYLRSLEDEMSKKMHYDSISDYSSRMTELPPFEQQELRNCTLGALQQVADTSTALLYRLMINCKAFITVPTHPSIPTIDSHAIIPPMLDTEIITNIQHQELYSYLYYLTPKTSDFFELVASKTAVGSIAARVSTLINNHFVPQSLHTVCSVQISPGTGSGANAPKRYNNPLGINIDESLYLWLLSRVTFSPLITTALSALLLLLPGRRRGWCTQYVAQIIWNNILATQSMTMKCGECNHDSSNPSSNTHHGYTTISEQKQVYIANVLFIYLILTSVQASFDEMSEKGDNPVDEQEDAKGVIKPLTFFSTQWLKNDPFMSILRLSCTAILCAHADLFGNDSDKTNKSSKTPKQIHSRTSSLVIPSTLTSDLYLAKTLLVTFLDRESEGKCVNEAKFQPFDNGQIERSIRGSKQLNFCLTPICAALTMITTHLQFDGKGNPVPGDLQFNLFSSQTVQNAICQMMATANQTLKSASESSCLVELLNELPLPYVIEQVSRYMIGVADEVNNNKIAPSSKKDKKTTSTSTTTTSLCQFLAMRVNAIALNGVNETLFVQGKDTLDEHTKVLINSCQYHSTSPSPSIAAASLFSTPTIQPSKLCQSPKETPALVLQHLIRVHNNMVGVVTSSSYSPAAIDVAMPMFTTIYKTIITLFSGFKLQYPHNVIHGTRLVIPSVSPVLALLEQVLTNPIFLSHFAHVSEPLSRLSTQFITTLLITALSPNDYSSPLIKQQQMLPEIALFDWDTANATQIIYYPFTQLFQRDRIVKDTIAMCDAFPAQISLYITALFIQIDHTVMNDDDDDNIAKYISIFTALLPLTTYQQRSQFVDALLPVNHPNELYRPDTQAVNLTTQRNLQLILQSPQLFKTLLPYLPPSCFSTFATIVTSSNISDNLDPRYLELCLVQFTQTHLGQLVLDNPTGQKNKEQNSLLLKLLSSLFEPISDNKQHISKRTGDLMTVRDFFAHIDVSLNHTRANLIITILSIFSTISYQEESTQSATETQSLFLTLAFSVTKSIFDYISTIPTPTALSGLFSQFPTTATKKSPGKFTPSARFLIPSPLAALITYLMHHSLSSSTLLQALQPIIQTLTPHLVESISFYHALTPHPVYGSTSLHSRDILTTMLFSLLQQPQQQFLSSSQLTQHLSFILISETTHSNLLNKVCLVDDTLLNFFSTASGNDDSICDDNSSQEEDESTVDEEQIAHTKRLNRLIDWKKTYPSHFLSLFSTSQWASYFAELVSQLTTVQDQKLQYDYDEKESDEEQGQPAEHHPSDRLHSMFTFSSQTTKSLITSSLFSLLFLSSIYIQSLSLISTLLSIDPQLPQTTSYIASQSPSLSCLSVMFNAIIDLNMTLNGALFHYSLSAPLSSIMKLNIYNHLLFITTCPEVTRVIKTKSPTITNDMVEKYLQRQVDATILACNKYIVFVLKYGFELPYSAQLRLMAASENGSSSVQPSTIIKKPSRSNCANAITTTQANLLQTLVIFILLRNTIVLPWKQDDFFLRLPNVLSQSLPEQKSRFINGLLALIPSQQRLRTMLQSFDFIITPATKSQNVKMGLEDEKEEGDEQANDDNNHVFINDQYILHHLTSLPSFPFLITPDLLKAKRALQQTRSGSHALVSSQTLINSPSPFSTPSVGSVIFNSEKGSNIDSILGPKLPSEQLIQIQYRAKLLTLQLLYTLLTPTNTGHYRLKELPHTKSSYKQNSFELIRPPIVTTLDLVAFKPLLRVLMSGYQGTTLLEDLLIKGILFILQNLCAKTIGLPIVPLLPTNHPTNTIWVNGKNCHILPLLPFAPNAPFAKILNQVDDAIPSHGNKTGLDQSILSRPLHTRLVVVPHMFPLAFASYSISFGRVAAQQLAKRLCLEQQSEEMLLLEKRLDAKLSKIVLKLGSAHLNIIQRTTLQRLYDDLNLDVEELRREIKNLDFQLGVLTLEESQDKTVSIFRETMLSAQAKRLRRIQFLERKQVVMKKQAKEKKLRLKASHFKEMEAYNKQLEENDSYYGDASRDTKYNSNYSNSFDKPRSYPGGFKTRYELTYGVYRESDTDDEDEGKENIIQKDANISPTTGLSYDLPEEEWHTLIHSLYFQIPFKHFTSQFSPLILALGPSPTFLIDHTAPLQDIFRTSVQPLINTHLHSIHQNTNSLKNNALLQSLYGHHSTSSLTSLGSSSYVSSTHLASIYTHYDPGLVLSVVSTLVHLTQFSTAELLGSQLMTYLYKSLSISINSQLRAISYSILSQIYTLSITLDLRWQRDKANDRNLKEVEKLQKKIEHIKKQSLGDENLMLPEEVEELSGANRRLAELKKDQQQNRSKNRLIKAKISRENESMMMHDNDDARDYGEDDYDYDDGMLKSAQQVAQQLIDQDDISTRYTPIDLGLALNIKKYQTVGALPTQSFEGLNIFSLILTTLRSSLLSISRSAKLSSSSTQDDKVGAVEDDISDFSGEDGDKEADQPLTLQDFHSTTLPTLALSSIHTHFISLLTTLTTHHLLDSFTGGQKLQGNNKTTQQQSAQQHQHFYKLPQALIKTQPMFLTYLLRSHYFSFKSLPMYIPANHHYNLLLSPASGYALTSQHKQFSFFLLITQQIHSRFDFKYLLNSNIWSPMYLLYTQSNMNNHNLVQSLLQRQKRDSPESNTAYAQQRYQYKIKLMTCNWLQERILGFLSTLILGRGCSCHQCQHPLYYLLQQQNFLEFAHIAVQYHLKQIQTSVVEVQSGNHLLFGQSISPRNIDTPARPLTSALRTLTSVAHLDKNEVELHIALHKSYISIQIRSLLVWFKLLSHIFDTLTHYEDYRQSRDEHKTSIDDEDDNYNNDEEENEDEHRTRPRDYEDEYSDHSNDDSEDTLMFDAKRSKSNKKYRHNSLFAQFADDQDSSGNNILGSKSSCIAPIHTAVQSTFILFFPILTKFFTILFPDVMMHSNNRNLTTAVQSPYISALTQRSFNTNLLALLSKFTNYIDHLYTPILVSSRSLLIQSACEQSIVPPALLHLIIRTSFVQLTHMTTSTLAPSTLIEASTILSTYPKVILVLGQQCFRVNEDAYQSGNIIHVALWLIEALKEKLTILALPTKPQIIPNNQPQSTTTPLFPQTAQNTMACSVLVKSLRVVLDWLVVMFKSMTKTQLNTLLNSPHDFIPKFTTTIRDLFQFSIQHNTIIPSHLLILLSEVLSLIGQCV